jgi:RimJ/RimL family protein N-acetyltransferase
MSTELEKEKFEIYWQKYLSIIEQIAFKELKMHKIYTYAFDLRPNLYKVLIKSGFNQEVRLKEHCYFEGKFIDVVVHSKFSIYNA